MLLFALGATLPFGEAVAKALGLPLAPLEEREFEDGEHKARPLCDVRGADAYVVQGLHGGPEQSCNDKLCRLLFFLATLRDHGAWRVTAVVPYLAYMRKDRRTKPYDPLTARYVAQAFEAMGTDRLVTLEAHNVVALENAFRLQTLNLTLGDLFSEESDAMGRIGLPSADVPLVVASPDPGGVKRAQLFREALEARLGREIGAAFMEKRRSAGVVSGSVLAGEVEGARVLLVDDLVASGGTLVRAARACRAAGARDVIALAAHGLFSGDAAKTLTGPELSRLVTTDTVPPFRLDGGLGGKLSVLSAAPCFASALRRLSQDAPIEAKL